MYLLITRERLRDHLHLPSLISLLTRSFFLKYCFSHDPCKGFLETLVVAVINDNHHKCHCNNRSHLEPSCRSSYEMVVSIHGVFLVTLDCKKQFFFARIM